MHALPLSLGVLGESQIPLRERSDRAEERSGEGAELSATPRDWHPRPSLDGIRVAVSANAHPGSPHFGEEQGGLSNIRIVEPQVVAEILLDALVLCLIRVRVPQ